MGPNDVFVLIETKQSLSEQLYDSLAVDRIFNPLRTELSFLENLVLLRHNDLVQEVVDRKLLEPTTAYEWAVDVAHYFRHFTIHPRTDSNAFSSRERGPRESGVETGSERDDFLWMTIESDYVEGELPTVVLAEPDDDSEDKYEYALSFLTH